MTENKGPEKREEDPSEQVKDATATGEAEEKEVSQDIDTDEVAEAPTEIAEGEAEDAAEIDPNAEEVVADVAPEDDQPEATVEDFEPRADPEPAPASPPPAARRSSRLVNVAALVAGGLIAALIGFGLARFDSDWPSGTTSEELAAQVARIDRIEMSMSDDAATRAELSGQLGELRDAVSAGASGDAVAAVQAELAGIRDELDTFNQRLTDLENRPIPDIGATEEAVAAYDRELRAMRAMFEAELARVELSQQEAIAAQLSAAEASRTAQIRAAISRLEASLDAGDGLADPVADLTSAGVEIPPALQAHMDDVPGVAELAAAFPDAARDVIALDLKARADSGEISRTEAFLKSQINARSLVPVEGGSADAILSRAEAALGEGDVAGALQELENLPETGSAAMQTWMDRARTYTEVEAAIAELGADTGQ